MHCPYKRQVLLLNRTGEKASLWDRRKGAAAASSLFPFSGESHDFEDFYLIRRLYAGLLSLGLDHPHFRWDKGRVVAPALPGLPVGIVLRGHNAHAADMDLQPQDRVSVIFGLGDVPGDVDPLAQHSVRRRAESVLQDGVDIAILGPVVKEVNQDRAA